MKPKSQEVFLPGPAGRLEGKYYKNPKFGSPVAIVLQPHPQYGGSMNNKVVPLAYNIFLDNGFSVIGINFRGVGEGDGVFDNGQGWNKPHKVTKKLAEMAGITAYILWYKLIGDMMIHIKEKKIDQDNKDGYEAEPVRLEHEKRIKYRENKKVKH